MNKILSELFVLKMFFIYLFILYTILKLHLQIETFHPFTSLMIESHQNSSYSHALILLLNKIVIPSKFSKILNSSQSSPTLGYPLEFFIIFTSEFLYFSLLFIFHYIRYKKIKILNHQRTRIFVANRSQFVDFSAFFCSRRTIFFINWN